MNQSTESRLNDVLDEIAIIYSSYDENNTPLKKINSYNKCSLLITEAKRLIEELKIEIINMDNNPKKASQSQMQQAQTLIDLLQLPGLKFDHLKQIIVSLREIDNEIPSKATIIDNIEKEILYDEVEIDINTNNK